MESFKSTLLLIDELFESNEAELSDEVLSSIITTVGGVSDSQSSIFLRLAFLIVGDFKYLPLNYTLSGYFSPIIINLDEDCFFSEFESFISIDFYNFSDKKINISYEKYKSYYVFFSKISKTNFNILFFTLVNQKMDFLNYSNFIKQYNIYFLKNDSITFFRYDWLINDEDELLSIDRKNINNINVQSKHKHLLKFHRNNYNSTFETKFRSYRLTKVFLELSKIRGNFLARFFKMELVLVNILLRVKFAYNISDSSWLIKNGHIFINSVVCYNINYQIKKGDLINLAIFIPNYVNYRFYLSNEITRFCRMWTTYYKFLEIKQKPYKTQPTSKKKWLIKSFWNNSDIPKFFEVDFLTLSIIVVYSPLSNKDIYALFLNEFKLSFIKYYNWKYYY